MSSVLKRVNEAIGRELRIPSSAWDLSRKEVMKGLKKESDY